MQAFTTKNNNNTEKEILPACLQIWILKGSTKTLVEWHVETDSKSKTCCY